MYSFSYLNQQVKDELWNHEVRLGQVERDVVVIKQQATQHGQSMTDQLDVFQKQVNIFSKTINATPYSNLDI